VSSSWKISESCRVEVALSWEINAGKELFYLNAWMQADCRRFGNFTVAGFGASCDTNGSVFSLLL